MKEFLNKYKIYILLIVIIISLIISAGFLFQSSYNIRKQEKEGKILIDSLHKDNKSLIKELQLNKDSILILHNLAISTNNQDTVYVNKIKYLKNQTNEEVNSVYNNSVDSNLRLHAKLSTEFISGLSGKDSI